MRMLAARLLLAAVPLGGLVLSAPPASAMCNLVTYELGLGCDPVCDVMRDVADATGQEWSCLK